MEEILTPLAEELISHFPESRFEVSGVFGMCCETSISIHGKDNSLIAFLQFVPNSDNDLLLRDYTVDRHLYNKGSIAEMNGANHPDIPIPAREHY